jgi:mycothiol synthase
MTVSFRQFQSADATELAELRAWNAPANDFDPLSTMESLPDAAALIALAENSSWFRVVWVDDAISGYVFVRRWHETDGPQVNLCDWYAPADLEEQTLHSAEAAAIDGADRSGDAVIGTNASSAQPRRVELLHANGYDHTFTQIEMTLPLDSARLVDRSLPDSVVFRDVTVDDASALIDLTVAVWAGRAFFTMPTVSQFDGWLRRSDLTLFNVAVVDGTIVGFVASNVGLMRAEIEDLQVHPHHQRRGIATALLSRNLAELHRRDVDVVRLNTEAHDPAGARSLYESIGFTVHREYLRFRKPLP